ncbi:MAG: dihydrodipicolinate synthase family protein [Actinobacteria bacterium]|nr:dihydrodipicolinate synthase family protein [Actinomycetota bacterium]
MQPPRLMPALVTPFTRTGDLDLDAHRHNLTTLTERKIKGFLIAGSTGEGPYLEPGERQALLDTARNALGNKTFLLCGIAAETVRTAVRQTAEAVEAGADAILAMTPTTLARGNHAAVRRFFLALADASPLPVMIYSVPPWTAYEIPTDLVVELSHHANIVGMKDSGGDVARMARLVQETPVDFLLFTGATRSITFCVTAGAYGAITASSNYLTATVLDVIAKTRRSPRSALSDQAELTRIASAVEAYRIPGVKAAAEMVGLRPGYPRVPLAKLGARDVKKIKRALLPILGD